MNKIAIFSDVHSNIFALTAFVKKVRAETNRIYSCGDILGYYPYQEETISIFDKYGIISVRGNHDKYITGLLEPRRTNKMLEKSIVYGRRQLTKKTRDFIQMLPDTLNFNIAGHEIAVFHGLFEDCERRVLKGNIGQYLRKKEILSKVCDFNFFGHTHIPFIKKQAGKVFVNAGSLGYSRDGGPSYIIFDLDKNEIKECRFKYKTEKLKMDIKKQRFDEDYKQMLLSNL